MKRVIVTVIAILLVVSILPGVVSASVYDSYTYNNQDEEKPIQDSYKVEKIISGKGEFGSFFSPSDIAVDESGYVYVLDSGNNRVVVFDENLNFVKSISTFKNGINGPAERGGEFFNAVFISQRTFVNFYKV